jgi:hypothetical protein
VASEESIDGADDQSVFEVHSSPVAGKVRYISKIIVANRGRISVQQMRNYTLTASQISWGIRHASDISHKAADVEKLHSRATCAVSVTQKLPEARDKRNGTTIPTNNTIDLGCTIYER